MYDKLIKRLRNRRICIQQSGSLDDFPLLAEAADAIEELSAEVSRLQLYANNISNLPDCNSCLKKNMCGFRPRPGEYCRINCPDWIGVMDTKEADNAGKRIHRTRGGFKYQSQG